MRGLICLLLVAVASAKPGYDYPQPAVPFNPFVPPTTTAPPPPPPTTTAPPPPTTTVFVCTPGSQDERCPPDCSPGSTDPRCPPPPTVPSLEYLPPVTTAPPPPPPPPTTAAPPPPPPTTTAPPPPPPPPTTTAPPPPPPPPTTTAPPPPPPPPTTTAPPPPPPTTTVPPPPPTTAFVCTPGSQDARCPPDCSSGSTDPRCPPPPPPPTTAAPPPPPPPPTTAAPPPPPPVEPDLEYLPPPDTPKEPSGESAVVIVPERTTTSRPAPPPPPSAPVVETPSGSAGLPVVMDKPAMEMLLWDYKESIPGEPEIDYPILEKIPETAFTCEGRLAGYYADIETRCQVFHVCSFLPEGSAVKNSFLCPNGTLFNQENFACQWWADIDCPTSDQFYKLNENIGKIPEKAQVKRQSPATVGARSFVPDGPIDPAALARSPFSPRQMRLKRKLARENQNL